MRLPPAGSGGGLVLFTGKTQEPEEATAENKRLRSMAAALLRGRKQMRDALSMEGGI